MLQPKRGSGRVHWSVYLILMFWDWISNLWRTPVSGSNYVWSEFHFIPYPSPHTYLLQTLFLPFTHLPTWPLHLLLRPLRCLDTVRIAHNPPTGGIVICQFALSHAKIFYHKPKYFITCQIFYHMPDHYDSHLVIMPLFRYLAYIMLRLL